MFKGEKFGNIKILSICRKIYPSEGWKRDFIEYECSCGFKNKTWKNNLLSKIKNNRLSCNNCIRRKKALLDPKIIVFKALFKSYINAAKNRDRIFSLSEDEAKNLFHGLCFYCGDSPKNAFKHRRARFREPYYYNGIDRMNNNLGYTLENSVSCCKQCNLKKSDMNLDDFLAFIVKIYKHSIERKNV